MSERLVIVGANAIGRLLAQRLRGRYQVIVLDKNPPADVKQRIYLLPEEADQVDAATEMVLVRADATSRLVLESLRRTGQTCAMVAVTSSDDANIEACRLAGELGYQPVVALARDSGRLEDYRKIKAVVLDRTLLLADHLENSLRHRGAVVPVGIGHGRGELLEITVLSTSPLVGRPLKEISPHRWRVAAVFRGEEVIVPTGDTVIEAQDRVLLVGDPAILTTMAEHLRLGRPQFPRPFGPNIVTLEFARTPEFVVREAEALASHTAARALVRGIPSAPDHEPFKAEEAFEETLCPKQPKRFTFDLKAVDSDDFDQSLRRQLAGVVVVAAKRQKNIWQKISGRPAEDTRLCDRQPAPVLFSRGTFPYERILLPISGSTLALRAAEVAIDLTRQFDARLTVLRVDLPEFLSGKATTDLLQAVSSVQRLCQLYEVRAEYLHRIGNPIKKVVEESAQHNLVVVARRHRRRDSLFDPDVALEVSRRSRCSVLVITVQPED